MEEVIRVTVEIHEGEWPRPLLDELKSLDPDERAEYLQKMIAAGHDDKHGGDPIDKALPEDDKESADQAIVEAFFPELASMDSGENCS